MSGGCEHFDETIGKVLDRFLDPAGTPAGSVCFPRDLPNQKIRAVSAMTPVEWLRHCAEQTESWERLAITEKVAFTAEISWTAGRIITEVHAHAVVLDVGVVEAIRGKKPGYERYLRLDFEPWNLGSLFPDPMVHTHASLKGPPRFPVSHSSTAPHIDFIELVLRNFERSLWERWADRVWERRIGPNLGANPDPRARIKSAFVAAPGQYKLLSTQLKAPVEHWKKVLIEEKLKMSSFVYDTKLDALNYSPCTSQSRCWTERRGRGDEGASYGVDCLDWLQRNARASTKGAKAASSKGRTMLQASPPCRSRVGDGERSYVQRAETGHKRTNPPPPNKPMLPTALCAAADWQGVRREPPNGAPYDICSRAGTSPRATGSP